NLVGVARRVRGPLPRLPALLNRLPPGVHRSRQATLMRGFFVRRAPDRQRKKESDHAASKPDVPTTTRRWPPARPTMSAAAPRRTLPAPVGRDAAPPSGHRTLRLRAVDVGCRALLRISGPVDVVTAPALGEALQPFRGAG